MVSSPRDYWEAMAVTGVTWWKRLNPMLWVRVYQDKKVLEMYLDKELNDAEEQLVEGRIADDGNLYLLNAIKSKSARKKKQAYRKATAPKNPKEDG